MSEWISVEDRLPENHTNKVLATVEYCTKNRYVLFAHYEEHIGWWNLETDLLFNEKEDKVIAWMELPEPYKQI